MLWHSILMEEALNVESCHIAPVQLPKKLYIHPSSASLIQLPDGRLMAYQEKGVTTERATFTLIAPKAFLSSRLAGIPGIKESLLEEFGVRFVTYDLPGFGESDPHPSRNLNSSALDMLHLANAVGVMDKFWVLGYSGGGMHAWAAVRYIPDRLAECNPLRHGPLKNDGTPTLLPPTPTRYIHTKKREAIACLKNTQPSYQSDAHAYMHTTISLPDYVEENFY